MAPSVPVVRLASAITDGCAAKTTIDFFGADWAAAMTASVLLSV